MSSRSHPSCHPHTTGRITHTDSAESVIEKWLEQARDFEAVEAHVPAHVLIRVILRDFEDARSEERGVALTLRDAARESGLSADHLGRLVAKGRIPNAGRKGAPRIRRKDLPRKSCSASSEKVVNSNRTQIARDAIAPFIGDHNG